MASIDIDILDLHSKICNSFDEESQRLEHYEKQIELILDMLTSQKLLFSIEQNLKNILQKLEYKIENIKTGKNKQFYIMETAEIIQKYQEIIKKPVIVSFMSNENTCNKEKLKVIGKYLEKVNKHSSINYTCLNTTTNEDIDFCQICNKNSNFIELDGYTVCTECGNETEIAATSSSYKDAERVNVGSKYTYDKRIHFRDCINQFQGKQNSTILPEVYEKLEKEFRSHGLLIDSDKKHKKFQNITKEHVLLFLKETSNSKHYEDAVLIHYNLTGKKPPDIGHLEKNILADFDKLVKTYEEKFKPKISPNKQLRKNFINNQYVLYQLLKKYKFPCDISEFSILKTNERKSYHDDICKELFRELGWNFCSVF